ncbi:hypothetical protein CC78DRAFT_61934 [Lojkania enalia]|uniref:Uncharacterized protein n=1 Tax=Lojkania enalia TaxID=147567 RepID=A0A9P4KFD7_9PLEO|nr:hypothetical protein CC78DRAFT_61934 [Didymosphaeria enalia]
MYYKFPRRTLTKRSRNLINTSIYTTLYSLHPLLLTVPNFHIVLKMRDHAIKQHSSPPNDDPERNIQWCMPRKRYMAE